MQTRFAATLLTVALLAGLATWPLAAAPAGGTASQARPAAAAGDVVISEVMYDSKNSTDVEFVELYNATNDPIDIGNWVVADDSDTSCSGEGCWTLPAGTVIPAGGFVVVCRDTSPCGVPTEVGAVQSGSFALNNGGDNLALYDGTPASANLIYGSLAVNFPDLAAGNVGDSEGLIDPSAGWLGTGAWYVQTTLAISNTAEYAHDTPGAANDGWETTAPAAPTAFSATGGAGSVTLGWTNPGDTDLRGVVLVRRPGFAPTFAPATRTSYSAGQAVAPSEYVVCAGMISGCVDSGLVPGQQYYYALYAYDEVRNYSAAASADAGVTPVTYHTITFDGTVSEWGAEEQLGTVDGVTWYATWDATYLYFAMTGGDTGRDKYNFAIDIDPNDTGAANSGTVNEYCGATFPADGKPDYVVQRYPGGTAYADGTGGGWAGWLPAGGTSAASGTNEVEFRVNRADVGVATTDPVAVYLWTCNNSNQEWGSWPPENVGWTGTAHVLTTRIQFDTTDANRNPRWYGWHRGVETRAGDATGNQQYFDDYANLNIQTAGASGCQIRVNVRGNAAAETYYLGGRRSYTITPIGCASMAAHLTLKYEDGTANSAPSELNGITETALRLYRFDGSAWQDMGGTVDVANNKVTVLGISSFSPWTFGGPPGHYPTDLREPRRAAVAQPEMLGPAAAVAGLCLLLSAGLFARRRARR